MTIADLSTKYTCSEFKIDNYCVPAPQLGAWLHETESITRSYNNSGGTFISVIIANKDKFNWAYSVISLEDMRVLDAYIKAKLSAGTNSFQVTSWTPDRGYITKRCYVGVPIQVTPVTVINETAQTGYFKFEYHWIQIEGHKSLANG